MNTKQRIILAVLLLAFCMSLGSTMGIASGLVVKQAVEQLDIHPAKYPQDGFWEIVVWEDGSFTIGNTSGCIPGMLCDEE